MNEKSLLTRLSETLDEYRAERRTTTPEQETRLQSPIRLRRFLRWLMPNGGTLLLIAALILTQNVWARTAQSTTNAPGPSATTVNYQGRLADSSGSPLDGNYGMTFALYADSTDGSPIWGPESHAAVPVSEGLFSVGLGSQTSGGIPTTTWNGDRYLEIAVGGETLSPRELIRSVPIAGMALTLPDHTVNGAMLAQTGFGANNASLYNFIPRGPVTSADFTDGTEVGEAVWDLSSIVGDSAKMVALQVWLADSAAYSYFQAWPNGESRNTGVNAPFIRTLESSQSNLGVLWVRCDSQQIIKYRIQAKGSSNLDIDLQVTVIGWIEPAAAP